MNFLSLSKSHFLKFYGTFIAVFQFGFLLSTTSQTFGQSGDIAVNVDINQSINIELNASSLADANSSFYILSQPSSGSLSSIELVDQEQLENPSGIAEMRSSNFHSFNFRTFVQDKTHYLARCRRIFENPKLFFRHLRPNGRRRSFSYFR